jgi:Ca-activated chloride channel family protein
MQRTIFVLLGVICCVALVAVGYCVLRTDHCPLRAIFYTSDQLAQRLFEQGRFAAAAEGFQDPLRQGVAWYRAGAFDKAAAAFGRVDTAAGWFDRGNALVLQGKYADAITSYDHALQRRPAWRKAQENRDLAQQRLKALTPEGGDATGGQIPPDEIVIGQKGKKGGQPVDTPSQQLSDAELRSLWLRRVQTKPADFLRAKFAYQLSRGQAQEGRP